jgi:speckle-type POZ protein
MPVPILMCPEKGFHVNDCVILKTEVTVYTELIHEETSDNPNTVAVKSQTLVKCMKNLLSDQAFSGDVQMYFTKDKSVRISAHRCILMARSPVFHAMFSSEMTESVTGEIFVEDIDPAVMNELLNYMYTDSFSSETIIPVMADELLAVATKYDVIGVVFECETFLIQQIASDTVIELLILSDICNAATLKQRCLSHIASHCVEVSRLPDFRELRGELLLEAQAAMEPNLKTWSAKSSSAVDKKSGGCLVS